MLNFPTPQQLGEKVVDPRLPQGFDRRAMQEQAVKLIEAQAAAGGIDRGQEILWRKIMHDCCRARRDHGAAHVRPRPGDNPEQRFGEPQTEA